MYLKVVLGGWPIAGQSVNKDMSDPVSVMAKLERYLFAAILDVTVTRDPDDSLNRVLKVKYQDLGIEYY